MILTIRSQNSGVRKPRPATLGIGAYLFLLAINNNSQSAIIVDSIKKYLQVCIVNIHFALGGGCGAHYSVYESLLTILQHPLGLESGKLYWYTHKRDI